MGKVWPVVSAYWITGFRFESVRESILDFLNKTDYPALDLHVVDFSVGELGKSHRNRLIAFQGNQRNWFRQERYCAWNNANFVLEKTTGDYIIHLEDDVILSETIPPNWIHECVTLFEKDSSLGAISLYSKQVLEPHAVGFISPRWVRDKWGPWKCFPTAYSYISESMMFGDRDRLLRFSEMNLNCYGFDWCKTSLSQPSSNLVKLSVLEDYSFQELDDLTQRGHTFIRDDQAGYVSHEEYLARGGWKGFNFLVRSQGGDVLFRTTPLNVLVHRLTGWIKLKIKKYFKFARKN